MVRIILTLSIIFQIASGSSQRVAAQHAAAPSERTVQPDVKAALAGLLITIVPLALMLVKLFSAYSINFKTRRGMHSGVLLVALILFAYSLLVGLSGFWMAGWFNTNSLALTLIGHCVWLAVYGAFTSLALFMVMLVSLLLRQLADWTRSRLGNP